MSDLTFKVDDRVLNVRVGAIITRDDKVLMVRDKRCDYLYTVGGRVRMGESSVDAVIRECEEEVGVRLSVDRLGFISECHFRGDNLTSEGTPIYEIGFYYYMQDNGEDIICNDFTDGDRNDSLVWADINGSDKVHPAWLMEELRCPTREIKHIIFDEEMA